MSEPDLRETVPDDSGEPAAPADRPAPAGRLGQYVLLELLGRGGMGAVYKARHALLDRVVALKILAAARVADPQAVARFLREIKAVGKLDHPNLVRGTDAGHADGRHFLVMDFLDGTDLGKAVQQLGPLPVADACELVRQAALGLQHAHEHGLVHRDVKPSNLLLTPGGQVKVLDLGLARLLGEVPLGDELTDTGQYMGTADYMAPEQGFDAHSVDIRADVYSLGCTLYKLLAGRAPFSGPEYDSTFKKIQAHAQVPIPPVQAARPDVPAALAAVLGRLLAKAPDDRYATPAAAAAALRPFAAGCDLARLAAALASAAEASASAPSPLADPLPRVPARRGSDTPFLPPPGPTPRRRRWPVFVLAAVLVAAGAGLAAWLAGWIPSRPPDNGGPAALAPGEWHDLLPQEPTRLHWPAGAKQSLTRPDGDGGPLLATCMDGRGLLAFGQTEATTYELEMEFRQEPWVGGVGLFFGYHRRTNPQGKEVPTYLLLRLQPKEIPGAPAGAFFFWEELDVLTTAKGGQIHHPVRLLSSTGDFRLDPGTHRLKAAISERGLEGVFWDGRKLPMTTDHLRGFQPPIHFQGYFGACTINSTSMLTRFRYHFLAR